MSNDGDPFRDGQNGDGRDASGRFLAMEQANSPFPNGENEKDGVLHRVEKRNPDGTYAPGHCGGPGWSLRKYVTAMSTRLHQAVYDVMHPDRTIRMVHRLADIACGDIPASNMESVAAAKVLMERMSPPEKDDQGGETITITLRRRPGDAPVMRPDPVDAEAVEPAGVLLHKQSVENDDDTNANELQRTADNGSTSAQHCPRSLRGKCGHRRGRPRKDGRPAGAPEPTPLGTAAL